ncbi:MAG: hypothetical protein ACFB9N_14800 [Geitlerinemataceae cyanobacterium]
MLNTEPAQRLAEQSGKLLALAVSGMEKVCTAVARTSSIDEEIALKHDCLRLQ